MQKLFRYKCYNILHMQNMPKENNLNYLDRLNNPLQKNINLQYFMSEKADIY